MATVEGGGININGCSPVFDHCTVSGNSSTLGDGLFMMDWSYPEFTNSIVWGNNETDIHVPPDGGDILFAYSDVGGGGVFPGTGNINEDPLFADAENGDFSLTWANYPVVDETKSPCIDSGDPAYPLDPDGSVTDMGAHEYQEFVALQQTLTINAGWSGISSYLIPYFKNPEILFGPILDDLIILQNYDGFFWPEQNMNTLGDWEHEKGYLIKLTDSANLTISGFSIDDKSITLQAGWNLIPVLCSCGMAVEEISLQLGENLILIQEVAGTNIYWPAMNIHTLNRVEAGKSYYLLMLESAVLNFDDVDK